MARLNRAVDVLTKAVAGVALSGAFWIGLISPTVVRADGPAAPPAMAAPGDIGKHVEDFWHYAKIARYDLATAEADKILGAGATPLDVLKSFTAVSADHKDDLDQWFARWQKVDGLSVPAGKLSAVLDEGRLALRQDPAYIDEQIQRLSVNERAYMLAVDRLRGCGELAVPAMLDYIKNPAKAEFHGALRRALVDLGKAGLNPLVVATAAKDQITLLTVVNTLGDIGYDVSVPYLQELAQSADQTAAVKTAATISLGKLGATVKGKAANSFYDLAERFYNDKATVTADPKAKVAFVWSWAEDRGLTKKDVAPVIFNKILAMKAAEKALALDAANQSAISLWLAANYEREVLTPADMPDATRPEGWLGAHYYGVSSGHRYLNEALARTLKDGNSSASLAIVKSMGQIVGGSELTAGSTPAVVDAMAYPDKAVRLEAALVVAKAMPNKAFAGQDRVVPLLSEAVAQTGKRGIVLVLKSEDEINKYTAALEAAGFTVAGATKADAAIIKASSMPAVDAFLVSEDAGNAQVDGLIAMAAGSTRFAATPKVVIVGSGASPYAVRAVTDKLVSVTTETDPAQVVTAVDAGMSKGGVLPIAADTATNLSVRAADLLAGIAESKATTLDASTAIPTLIGALADSRPAVAKAAANALGKTGDKSAQAALLAKAADEKAPEELRLANLAALGGSAKVGGNQLSADDVAAVKKLADSAASPALRNAAAEVGGSLNLSPEQTRDLILKAPTMMPAKPAEPKS